MKTRLALVLTFLVLATVAAGTAHSATGPTLLRDHQAARNLLKPSITPGALDDVIQPDTQIEPSIAVNPTNALNAVAGFQEGRRSNGGDETNGFAATLDGGRTWTFGEVPGLTRFVGGAKWDRASDAVVAFGPDGQVFYNSLVFDMESEEGLCSGIAVNVSHDGGRTWSDPAFFQDDCAGGLNDKNWIVVDNGTGPGHHPGRVYVVWDRVDPVVYNYCDSLETDCSQASNWLPNFLTISPLQGIGAIPLVLSDGSLGVVYESITALPRRAATTPMPSDRTRSSSRWRPGRAPCHGPRRSRSPRPPSRWPPTRASALGTSGRRAFPAPRWTRSAGPSTWPGRTAGSAPNRTRP